MEFKEHIDHPAAPGSLTVDLTQQLHGVHGLYHRDVGHDVFHLIGLEVTDEMPLDVSGKLLVLDLQFLHMTLTEEALPLAVGRHDALHRVVFAHSHEPDTAGQTVEHLMQMANDRIHILTLLRRIPSLRRVPYAQRHP